MHRTVFQPRRLHESAFRAIRPHYSSISRPLGSHSPLARIYSTRSCGITMRARMKTLTPPCPPFQVTQRDLSTRPHTSPTADENVTFAELATVDLSPFFTGVFTASAPTEAQQECANHIGHATTSLGFLYVSNSALTPLIPYINTAAKWFFDQTAAAKQSTRTDNTQRGYHHFLGSPHTVSLDSLSDTPNQDGGSTAASSGKVNIDHIEAYTMQSPWLSASELREIYDSENEKQILGFAAPSSQSAHITSPTSTWNAHAQTRIDHNRNPFQHVASLENGIVLPYSNLKNTNPSNPYGRVSGPEEHLSGGHVNAESRKAFIPENMSLIEKFRWLLQQEARKPTSSAMNAFQNAISTPFATGTKNMTPSFGTDEGEYNRWPSDRATHPFTAELFGVPYDPTHSSTHSKNDDSNTKTSALNAFIEHLPPFPLQMDAELFRTIAITYYCACIITSEAITQALSLYLGTDANKIINFHSLASHTLEMKKYPPMKDIKMSSSAVTSLDTGESASSTDSTRNDSENSVAVGSPSMLSSLNNVRLRFPVHSDLSTLTLLTQTHDKGGLLLKCRINQNDSAAPSDSTSSHKWLRAPMRRNAVIVNTGDFFQWMTLGSVQSTLHCVASDADDRRRVETSEVSEEPRFSTVFFYQPDMHAVIEPLDMTRFRESCPAKNADNAGGRGFEPFMAGDRYPFL